MEIRRYLQMFSLKTVVVFFTLLSHFCTHGQLEIRRMESLIKVRPGDNMTLPCLFYGYKTPLDLSKVAVRWTVKTSDEKVKQVYWFDGGKRIQNRPGLNIPDSELMEGNGSLYIPNIQPSDDGEYTCTVIVTPEKATSNVTMEVSAKPTCKLSDSRLEMNPDNNDTVICYVNGFYPEHVKIQWVKYRNGFYNNSELDRSTWIREPVQNRDGTYNMASLLTLRPKSTEEDGDVYSCVIHHRSLEDPLQLNVTISVQPAPEPSKCGYIIFIILLVNLLIIGLSSGFYIYKKVSLQVSEITGNGGNRILVSQISGLRPRKMIINLYLIKRSEKKIKVDSWSPKTLSQQDDVEHTIMPLRTMDDSTGVYLEPVISSDKWFSFKCVCFIHIPPQFQIDDGTGLILEVNHTVLRWPICRSQQMHIKGNLSAQDVCNGKR